MNRLALALAAALAFTSLPAHAGPPSGDVRAEKRGDGKREEIRARVQQKVKTYLTVELSTRLGLDDKKSAKLADAIAAHMERKRANREAMKNDMKKLRELVDAKAPDAQVKAQLDVVIKQREKGEDVQTFLKETSSFLSVQEQAKLALAMPDVMRGLKGMMQEARKGARGGRFKDREMGPGGF
jgi:hypothetical protein